MRPPAPLQQRDFRSLWLAGLVSDAGDWLLLIALPIIVYDLTRSASSTSLAFLVELAPGVALAPLAGWCADRWDRRRLLVTVSLLQAAGLVPLLVPGASKHLPLIYAVILVEAALAALFDPAKNALLPSLLAPGDLVPANSMIGLSQNIGRLVGGPLGSILLAAGGLRIVGAADLFTYLTAAALIGRLRPSALPGPPGATSENVPARRTWSLSAWRSSTVRTTLLVTFVSQIAQGIFVVSFILFVAQRLHGGSAEIGLLRGVQAIGAVGGGLALTVWTRDRTPSILTAAATAAFGLISLTVCNAPFVTTDTAVYIGLFILVGVPGIALATGLTSTLQWGVGDQERGRIFSVFGLVGNLGQAVGMTAAGLLIAPLGLQPLLNTQAILYLASGAIAARWMTRRLPRSRAPQGQLS